MWLASPLFLYDGYLTIYHRVCVSTIPTSGTGTHNTSLCIFVHRPTVTNPSWMTGRALYIDNNNNNLIIVCNNIFHNSIYVCYTI